MSKGLVLLKPFLEPNLHPEPGPGPGIMILVYRGGPGPLLYGIGFATAVAHARLHLSRLELIGGSGRTAGRYVTLQRSPSFRRPPLSRRWEALWEREVAGSGSQGAASCESAAGSGRLRGCGC